MCYVAGMLLSLVVGYTTYLIGYVLGTYLGAPLSKDSPTPWKNLCWRRAARRFLGQELAPSTDDLYFYEQHVDQWNKASEIEDPESRLKQQRWVMDYFLPRSLADSEWYWWYQVLSAYFAKPEWAIPAQYFLWMLHTSSWAIIFLMEFNHAHHWFAWVMCVLGIFLGNSATLFTGGLYGPDPYGTTQTARILREIRSDSAKPNAGEEPFAGESGDTNLSITS